MFLFLDLLPLPISSRLVVFSSQLVGLFIFIVIFGTVSHYIVLAGLKRTDPSASVSTKIKGGYHHT